MYPASPKRPKTVFLFGGSKKPVINTMQAAIRLGVTRQTIIFWIKSGKLQGQKDQYGHWQVTEQSVRERARAYGRKM